MLYFWKPSQPLFQGIGNIPWSEIANMPFANIKILSIFINCQYKTILSAIFRKCNRKGCPCACRHVSLVMVQQRPSTLSISGHTGKC